MALDLHTKILAYKIRLRFHSKIIIYKILNYFGRVGDWKLIETEIWSNVVDDLISVEDMLGLRGNVLTGMVDAVTNGDLKSDHTLIIVASLFNKKLSNLERRRHIYSLTLTLNEITEDNINRRKKYSKEFENRWNAYFEV